MQECFYCHKLGCFRLKKKTPSTAKPTGSIRAVAETAQSSNSCDRGYVGYEPFTFDGFVSISGVANDQKAVLIL